MADVQTFKRLQLQHTRELFLFPVGRDFGLESVTGLDGNSLLATQVAWCTRRGNPTAYGCQTLGLRPPPLAFHRQAIAMAGMRASLQCRGHPPVRPVLAEISRTLHHMLCNLDS